MNIDTQLIIVVKIVCASALGAFIGYDRERHGMEAGIRTYAAVCVGALLFTAIGEQLASIDSASRIIGNIVVGIGFLGAGVISRSNSNTKSANGLTTAATIWCTAAIGIAVGLDMYIIAVVGAFTIYFLLALHHMKWYLRWKDKMQKKEQHFE